MKRGSTIRPFVIKQSKIGDQDTRKCPFCGEKIKTIAAICHFCHSKLDGASRDNKGQSVRIRLKTGDRTYVGDVFLPENLRVSDLMSENRHFIVLENAVEEALIRDIPIGFLALNKTMTQWVELEPVKSKACSDFNSKAICLAA